MIINQTKLLFDLANDEAKKLQVKQGREPDGIRSTQVQGLIIALGTMLDTLAQYAEKEGKK